MIGHDAYGIEDHSIKDLTTRGVLGHGYIFDGPAMVGKRTVAHGARALFGKRRV